MAVAIGLRLEAVVHARSARIVPHRQLEIEVRLALEALDRELARDPLLGLGQVEHDVIALDVEPEQLERPLVDRAILEDTAAHARDEAIDMEPISLGLWRAVDPV